MGKQINFYMTPEDICDLENLIFNIEETIILSDRSNNFLPRISNSLTCDEYGQMQLFYYLARKKDLENIFMKHVSEQNYWAIDAVRSPVIEYTGCFYDGRILAPGRIYYIDKYYSDSGEIIEKSHDFKIWAKSVFRQTRKVLLKQEGNFRFIGKKAKALLEASTITLRLN